MKRFAGIRLDGQRAIHGSAVVLGAILVLLTVGLVANTLLLVLSASAATPGVKPAPKSTSKPTPSTSSASSSTTAPGGGERYTVRGADIAIYNLVGRYDVEGTTGTAVTVTVTRHGQDAGQLEIATGPVRGRETLRVIYPSDRIVIADSDWGWGTVSEMRVGEDGTFGDGPSGNRTRKVTISSRGNGLEASADLKVQVPKGQKVRFNLGAGEVVVANVNGEIVVDASSGGVTCDGVTGDLLIDTGSGDVRVDHMRGDLSVDTGSGHVTLANVDGESIQADTGSGGVDGTSVRAGRLMVDTGSGDIELDKVTSSDVSLDTGSGSVEVSLTSDIERLHVDTGSGSVTLRVPENVGASLDVETGSGDVDSELPIRLTRKSRDSLSGTVGDGKGSIVVETGSGSIRLLKL
jgi:lia operon protein LiaG